MQNGLEIADKAQSHASLRLRSSGTVRAPSDGHSDDCLRRESVIAPIVFRLVHIYQADISHGSPNWDPTMKNTETAIAIAVLMNTSLVLTCVPFLKPLMEALQPGWSTSDVVQGVGYSVMYGKGAIKFAQYPIGSVISGRGARRKEIIGGTITRTNNFQLESRSDEGNSRTLEATPVV
jgi:hypothetical protein